MPISKIKLICPICNTLLVQDKTEFTCPNCKKTYVQNQKVIIQMIELFILVKILDKASIFLINKMTFITDHKEATAFIIKFILLFIYFCIKRRYLNTFVKLGTRELVEVSDK